LWTRSKKTKSRLPAREVAAEREKRAEGEAREIAIDTVGSRMDSRGEKQTPGTIFKGLAPAARKSGKDSSRKRWG